MANNPIPTPLPADLPENWALGQTISPGGTEVGLDIRHGYNYLMQQVNAAQEAINTTGEAFSDLADKTDLSKKQNTITGAASTITGSNLTQNRALISNGSGKVAVSAVTSTELGYLQGCSGHIQPIIDSILTGKADIKVPSAAGNLAALDADGNLSDSGKQVDDFAEAGHKHSAADIISGTIPVSLGGTGTTTLSSGQALIGAGVGAVTTRAIRNNTTTTGTFTAVTDLITSNTLKNALNRTSSVAAANASYTTLMARGTSLNSAETTPAVNGAIAWTYE